MGKPECEDTPMTVEQLLKELLQYSLDTEVTIQTPFEPPSHIGSIEYDDDVVIINIYEGGEDD